MKSSIVSNDHLQFYVKNETLTDILGQSCFTQLKRSVRIAKNLVKMKTIKVHYVGKDLTKISTRFHTRSYLEIQ